MNTNGLGRDILREALKATLIAAFTAIGTVLGGKIVERLNPPPPPEPTRRKKVRRC